MTVPYPLPATPLTFSFDNAEPLRTLPGVRGGEDLFERGWDMTVTIEARQSQHAGRITRHVVASGPVVALSAFAIALAATGTAIAQDKGTLNPKPLPALAHPDDPKTAAKELFGRRFTAAPMQPRTIGFYAKGCLAGGMALPINGPTWQVMRLSRNRNWGHPRMIEFLERLSQKGAKVGWRGLLVGDMSQPRGGPMLTGHASHQVGLDADIWLTPMLARELTPAEREEMSATMVVAPDRKDVDPKVWTPAHTALIKAAAEEPRGPAHLRQCGDQEGALPRGRPRPGVVKQGAAILAARLPLPRPHPLSGRQSRLQAAGPGAGGRWLRQGSRLVVHRRRAASQARAAAEDATQAAAADDHGRPAAGLPAGAPGALEHFQEKWNPVFRFENATT